MTTLITILFLVTIIVAQGPINDDACDATPIVSCLVIGTLTDATVQTNEISPPADSDGANQYDWYYWEPDLHNSIWYKVTAFELELEIVKYNGICVNTQLAVYTVGDCKDFSTFTLIRANDDTGSCLKTSYILPFDEGVTQEYYIQVDGYNAAQGTFQMNITVDDACPPTQSPSLSPTQSTIAPTQSTTAPTQGTTAPTQGTTAPTQGTTTPTQGTTAPTQSTTAPTTASTQGTTTPTQAPTDSDDDSEDDDDYNESDDTKDDDSSDIDDDDMYAAVGLSDGENNIENDENTLVEHVVIRFSQSAAMNIFGIICVVILACSVAYCFCVRNEKKREKVEFVDNV